MRTSIFPGWWQVAVAMLVQAASAAAVFTAFSIMVAALAPVFEPSRTMLMLPLTGAVLMIGIANALLGPMVDRYSLRLLMLIGALLLGVGFVLVSYAQNMLQVVVVYALCLGTASVLLGPMAASALVVRWFHRRRGLALGIAASGTALGGLLIPPLLQGLIDTYEWRVGLRIFAAILLAVTVPVLLLFAVNRPADRNLHPDGAATPPPVSPSAQQHAAFGSTAGVLRSADFWLIALVVGSVFAGATALGSNLLPLVLDKGIVASQGALLLSVLSAGNFAGKLLFAAAADRFDIRLALAVGIVLAMLGVASFLYSTSYLQLMAAALLTGLGGGGTLPLWSLLVARTFGADNIGRVMGLMGSVVTCFNLAAPLLYGYAFDRAGSYAPALIGHIVLLGFALVLLPRLRSRAEPLPLPAT